MKQILSHNPLLKDELARPTSDLDALKNLVSLKWF